MRHSFRLLIIAAIFIAFACGAALAANPGANQIYPPGYSPGNPSANKKSPNAKTQPNVPQPQKNNVPAEAPGMKAIIREKGSTIVMSLRNVSQKPLSIKNEFMSAEMRNTSFVRVFLDQKETAGVEMFRKKMLIKNSEPVITLAPGKERQVLSIEFYNLPTGTHTMYASYSSQVPNYERKRYDWWLGTTSSNMVSIRVAQPELDKQIVSTGNKVMKEIVADLKKLTGKYGAMKGITTSSLKGGTGVFPGVVQLVFHGAGGMQITIQVRGADEQLNPYPDFDMKYPYIGVTVVCYVQNMRDPVLRNAVFNAVRDNAALFNGVVKTASAKKAMDIAPISQNLLSLVDRSDMIVQGLVSEAKTEVQDNQQQQWVVTVKIRKYMKGRTKDPTITVYTDSPTIRFKGSFVNKQFIMFLDLKYKDPLTYELLGAEAVNATTAATIEQRLEANKKKK